MDSGPCGRRPGVDHGSRLARPGGRRGPVVSFARSLLKESATAWRSRSRKRDRLALRGALLPRSAGWASYSRLGTGCSGRRLRSRRLVSPGHSTSEGWSASVPRCGWPARCAIRTCVRCTTTVRTATRYSCPWNTWPGATSRRSCASGPPCPGRMPTPSCFRSPTASWPFTMPASFTAISSPATSWWTGAGVVRVLDFGIARWEDGRQTTSVAGAPDYMAPEQVRGRSLDGRTDVYCFACLIYEIFTGWPLFCADSPIGVMLKHLEEPPPLDGAGARACLARWFRSGSRSGQGAEGPLWEQPRDARGATGSAVVARQRHDRFRPFAGGRFRSCEGSDLPGLASCPRSGCARRGSCVDAVAVEPPLAHRPAPSMTFAARAPKRSVAQTSTRTPLAPPATVLPPAPTTRPPTVWRAAPPAMPLPTLAPSGVTEPSIDVPTAPAASSTTAPTVPTTSTPWRAAN